MVSLSTKHLRLHTSLRRTRYALPHALPRTTYIVLLRLIFRRCRCQFCAESNGVGELTSRFVGYGTEMKDEPDEERNSALTTRPVNEASLAV